MQKLVDGKVVDLAPEELARREAEEAAFSEALKNPLPPPKSEREEIEELKARIATLEAKTAVK